MSGAPIGSSSMSGWRRYQSSIWRRCERCLRISSGSTTSPMALSVASVSSAWTRRLETLTEGVVTEVGQAGALLRGLEEVGGPHERLARTSIARASRWRSRRPRCSG